MNSSKIKKLIKNNLSQEKAFNVILKPIVTEKSTVLSENNQIVFLVNINSNKIDIKKSIELIYKVKVNGDTEKLKVDQLMSQKVIELIKTDKVVVPRRPEWRGY